MREKQVPDPLLQTVEGQPKVIRRESKVQSLLDSNKMKPKIHSHQLATWDCHLVASLGSMGQWRLWRSLASCIVLDTWRDYGDGRHGT